MAHGEAAVATAEGLFQCGSSRSHVVAHRQEHTDRSHVVAHRQVSFKSAHDFLRKCRVRPERMRTLCSTKSTREGGDRLAVSVEVAAGGPIVEVRELPMAEGWTGCRFSPAALWLAVALAERCRSQSGWLSSASGNATPPHALELGCGVGLAGLTAYSLGFHATLTDCLEGTLRSLQEHVATPNSGTDPMPAADQAAVCDADSLGDACAKPTLRVRRLNWLEEQELGQDVDCHIDRASPENLGSTTAASSGLIRSLSREESRSFDLVLASDVLYEEHHAVLLPAVMARWLRPGGLWFVSFAIRDADMLVRFLRQLFAVGVMTNVASGDLDVTSSGEVVCAVAWDTACVPAQCSFCRSRDECSLPGRMLPGTAAESCRVPLAFLEELVEAHEGGAILLEGRMSH